MTTHVSATALQDTLHASGTDTSQTNTTRQDAITTISDALRRRAQSIINDNSIDPRWRAIIRYGLEINDPWLADLVRRADAGEPIIDSIDFSLEPETLEEDSDEDKIKRMAEIISGTGNRNDAAAALFVLMGTLETSTHPKLLANAAKHIAFMRCAESNLFGIVDIRSLLSTGINRGVL